MLDHAIFFRDGMVDIISVGRYNVYKDVMTMNLQTMLNEKGMTIYHLSMASGVPKTTREFMAGVPHYDMGRKRCYLAIDVANRLASSEIA